MFHFSFHIFPFCCCCCCCLDSTFWYTDLLFISLAPKRGFIFPFFWLFAIIDGRWYFSIFSLVCLCVYSMITVSSRKRYTFLSSNLNRIRKLFNMTLSLIDQFNWNKTQNSTNYTHTHTDTHIFVSMIFNSIKAL